MRKNQKIKIFLGILFALIFFIIINTNSVKASSIGLGINDFKDETEKIMKYNIATGEISEVTKESFEQLMSMSTNNILSSYVPNKGAYIPMSIHRAATFPLIGERVTDTKEFPYRVTCKLETEFKTGNIVLGGSGSGSFVGPNIALTAAHCVFVSNVESGGDIDRELCQKITFYPGYNDGESYKIDGYGEFVSEVTEVYFSSKYTDSEVVPPDADWAICVLEKPLGHYLGFYRCSILWRVE